MHLGHCFNSTKDTDSFLSLRVDLRSGRGDSSKTRFSGDAVILNWWERQSSRKTEKLTIKSQLVWIKKAPDHLISRYCSLNEPCENFNERFPLIQIMVMPNLLPSGPYEILLMLPQKGRKDAKLLSIKDYFNSTWSLWWLQINTWTCHQNANQRKHDCVYIKYVPRRLEWNTDLKPG